MRLMTLDEFEKTWKAVDYEVSQMSPARSGVEMEIREENRRQRELARDTVRALFGYLERTFLCEGIQLHCGGKYESKVDCYAIAKELGLK